MKRLIYIILGIVILAGVGFLVFIFGFKGNVGSLTNLPAAVTGSLPFVGGGGTQTGTTGGAGASASSSGGGALMPGAANQGSVNTLSVVASSPVLDYFINASGTITAISPNGTILAVAAGTAGAAGNQTSSLSSIEIKDIISARFSYDGKMILANFGARTNPQSSIFTVANKTWTPLPAGMIAPSWSLSNSRIAFMAGASSTTLYTLNAALPGRAPTALLTLRAQDLVPQWLSGTQIVLSGRPTAYAGGPMLVYDLVKGTLSPIALDSPGLMSIWVGSTSSTIPLGLIFSRSASGAYALALDDTAGATMQALNFLTLPSKCAFTIARETPVNLSASSTATSSTAGTTAATDKKTAQKTPPLMPTYPALYCGIPRDTAAFSSAALPDAYDQMALYTSDDIYLINAASGAATALMTDTNQNLDVSDPKVFNGSLYFVNRYNQELYQLTPASSGQ